MSKREIPEINAGSMADIAFLLLIFFLVTTTMDKDQAYVRKIPKKLDVIVDVPEVEKRNTLAIKANSRNQLMVRGQIIENPDDISDKIIEFYNKNEKVNDPKNEFPMYSRISMSEIESFISKTEADLEKYEEMDDVEPAIITYTSNTLAEWEKKKRSLQLYGGNILPEIHFQANLRIEVQIATDYSLFAKIQTEIEEAIYEMRDKQAKRIFDESYGTITSRYALDQDKADKDKLDLLEILYPARIIEVTPKR